MTRKLDNLALALAEEFVSAGANYYPVDFTHDEIFGIPKGQRVRVIVERIIPSTEEERVTYSVPELAGALS